MSTRTIGALRGPEQMIGRRWQELDTPALLVELDRLEANIADMAEVAARHRLALRPHFKTHKATAITRRQLAAGAVGATVAKLDEAEALFAAGIFNLLVAYEIVAEPKLTRAIELAARGPLIFAVDSPVGAQALARKAAGAGLTLDVSIEIDSGLRRCGVVPDEAAPLARSIADLPGLRLTGVFTHGGTAYAARDDADLARIAEGEGEAVVTAAGSIRAQGMAIAAVSVGSTPTAARVAGYPGITELRPGNYVFYDAMQVALGTVQPERCALTIAATVVSRTTPERAVIDAGSKTLGLDRGAHSSQTLTDFGRPLGLDGALERLSEEHGIMRIPASSTLSLGDRVRVVPNHACTVSNMGRCFYGIRHGVIEEVIPIDAPGGVH